METVMKRSLFPHQLKNIYIMEKLEEKRKVKIPNGYIKTKLGILSDKTGYGKTASMLGLVARDKMEWNTNVSYKHKKIGQFCNNNGVICKNISFYPKIDTTLVMVPNLIIFQWKEELDHTFLKYLIVEKSSQIVDFSTVEKYDIVIVAAKVFNSFMSVNRMVAWKRFIFDEPGNTKVSSMHEVIANFYWFITATVGKIYPLHEKCKNSFMRGFLHGYDFDWWNIDYLCIRNDEKFLEESFKSVPIHHYKYYAVNKSFSIVKNYASELITQMVDAGNIRGAIKALGGNETRDIFELLKKEKTNHIQEYNNKIMAYKESENIKYLQDIENMEKEVEKIEKEILDIDEKYSEIIKSECMICYEPLKESVLESNCKRLFCGRCILTWLKESDKCPLCRQKIDETTLVYLKDKYAPDLPIVLTEKISILQDIIYKNLSGKFVIFSNWNQSFKEISNMLKKEKLDYKEIKSNARGIENIIKNFKTGNLNILLVNATYNGAGLNLQEATDIVLYHKLDLDSETQAIGRLNRIGRKTDIKVHHILYK